MNSKSTKKLNSIIKELWNDTNLKLVNDGIIGSVKKSIELPLGEIPYYTRAEVLKDKKTAPSGSIINSPYNREPFLSHYKTKVSKVAYLIRWIYGVADFNFLPVSLISNPKDNENMGIQMSNVLLGKDRGHFLTIFKSVIHDNESFDSSFWKSVKGKLQEMVTKGYACNDSLKTFQNVGMDDVISELSDSKVSFSLKELIEPKLYDRIFTEPENIQIRLETIETHKSEIESINNGENDWVVHNFALSRLTDVLIDNEYLDYNQIKIDEMCSNSPVMMGEKVYLSGRKLTNFSGFETEPLMIMASTLNKDFDKALYKLLSGNKDSSKRAEDYIECIVNKKFSTKQFQSLLKEIDTVSNITKDDGISNLWVSWNDAIDDMYDSWKITFPDKGETNKFNALKVGSMDTALILFRGIKYIMKETKVRDSGLAQTSKEFVEWFISEVDSNTHKFVKTVESAENSWGGKFDKILKPYIDRFITHKKSEQGNPQSVSKLKSKKLRQMRTKSKELELSYKFKMYDRKSTGWFITEIDLVNGTGLNLCHYISSKKSGMYTEENTDMGPEWDNKDVVKETKIPNTYFTPEGEFITDFKKEFPTPPSDINSMKAWLNTQTFTKFFE